MPGGECGGWRWQETILRQRWKEVCGEEREERVEMGG